METGGIRIKKADNKKLLSLCDCPEIQNLRKSRKSPCGGKEKYFAYGDVLYNKTSGHWWQEEEPTGAWRKITERSNLIFLPSQNQIQFYLGGSRNSYRWFKFYVIKKDLFFWESWEELWIKLFMFIVHDKLLGREGWVKGQRDETLEAERIKLEKKYKEQIK